jgi:hypothetical protein
MNRLKSNQLVKKDRQEFVEMTDTAITEFRDRGLVERLLADESVSNDHHKRRHLTLICQRPEDEGIGSSGVGRSELKDCIAIVKRIHCCLAIQVFLRLKSAVFILSSAGGKSKRIAQRRHINQLLLTYGGFSSVFLCCSIILGIRLIFGLLSSSIDS